MIRAAGADTAGIAQSGRQANGGPPDWEALATRYRLQAAAVARKLREQATLYEQLIAERQAEVDEFRTQAAAAATALDAVHRIRGTEPPPPVPPGFETAYQACLNGRGRFHAVILTGGDGKRKGIVLDRDMILQSGRTAGQVWPDIHRMIG